MKARLALTAIFIAFSVCFAEKPKTDTNNTEMVKSPKEMVYERDSVKCYADSIAEINKSLIRFISENTTESMVQAQKFYSGAFSQLQSSFSCFLTYISILAAIFFGTYIWGNIRIKFKFDRYDKDFLNMRNKFESDIETNKKEMWQEQQLEKIKMVREMGTMYFSLAIAYLKQSDLTLHFIYMAQHYNFLMTYKIELIEEDLENLKQLNKFIDTYGNDGIKVDIATPVSLKKYLNALDRLKQYCLDAGKKEYFAEAEKAYDTLTALSDAINQPLSTKGEPL